MSRTNTPKAAIHCQPQIAFGGAQAAENTRDWSKEQYDQKNVDPSHHYDHSRKGLNFTIDKDGIRPLSETSAAALMNRYVQRLADLKFTAYKPGTTNQPISYLDIVVSGNTEVMNRLAFGDQSIDFRRDADNSDIVRCPEIEQWAIDVYNFACRKFGEENVIGMEVHLDETTPHAHINVVPVDLRKERGRDRCVYKNIDNPNITLTAKEWKNLNSAKRKEFTRETIEDGRKSKMCVSYSGLVGQNRAARSKYMSQLHTDFHNEVGCKYGLSRGDHKTSLTYDEQLERRHKTSAELEAERIARLRDLQAEIDVARGEKKQLKSDLTDLKIEISINSRKQKSFETMIANLEKQRTTLQTEIANLKNSITADNNNKELLQNTLKSLEKQLGEVDGKLAKRQEMLNITNERLENLMDDFERISLETTKMNDEKRDSKALSEHYKEEAEKWRLNLSQSMSYHLNVNIIDTVINEATTIFKNLDESQKRPFEGTLLTDLAERGEAVVGTAMCLMLGVVKEAAAFAESHGGGGESPSGGWGKREDEDDREWARRCVDEARKMCTPAQRRRGRGR